MITRDALLIIDGRQCDYEFASVAFFPTFLKIDRVEQGCLDRWSIRARGPHFLLGIPPGTVLSALMESSFEHHFDGDLGDMSWYGGAAGRDGTGCRGVSSLDVTVEVSPDGNRLGMRVCGSLVDKEQIIFGALPPPRHRAFELSMSFPLDNLPELFEYCPEYRADISEALALK